jgi:hypothetical protein
MAGVMGSLRRKLCITYIYYQIRKRRAICYTGVQMLLLRVLIHCHNPGVTLPARSGFCCMTCVMYGHLSVRRLQCINVSSTKWCVGGRYGLYLRPVCSNYVAFMLLKAYHHTIPRGIFIGGNIAYTDCFYYTRHHVKLI